MHYNNIEISSLKLGGHRQQKPWNRTMEKLEKNWIKRIQKTYQSIFDPSHTCSTKRNLRNYWKDVNGTMKST